MSIQYSLILIRMLSTVHSQRYVDVMSLQPAKDLTKKETTSTIEKLA